jgi:hypothetical protein
MSVKYSEDTDQERGLLKRLESKLPGERLEAELELNALGGAGTTFLLKIIENENANVQGRKRLLGLIVGLTVAIVVPTVIAMVALGLFAALSGLIGLSGLGALGTMVAPGPRRLRATELLGQSTDARAIGPIADALSTQDQKAKLALIKSLFRLLPMLNYERNLQVTESQRDRIRKLLFTRDLDRESELAIVLIDGLVALQDIGALHVLHTISKKRVTTASGNLALQKAFQGIADLEAIKLQQDAPNSLLRASSDNGDKLLRAASSNGETPAEQLLRPWSTNGDTI